MRGVSVGEMTSHGASVFMRQFNSWRPVSDVCPTTCTMQVAEITQHTKSHKPFRKVPKPWLCGGKEAKEREERGLWVFAQFQLHP